MIDDKEHIDCHSVCAFCVDLPTFRLLRVADARLGSGDALLFTSKHLIFSAVNRGDVISAATKRARGVRPVFTEGNKHKTLSRRKCVAHLCARSERKRTKRQSQFAPALRVYCEALLLFFLRCVPRKSSGIHGIDVLPLRRGY